MTNLSGTNLNNGTAVGPQGEGKESPSRFPKYPAYKDSGVEWLGKTPEHWKVVPAKRGISVLTDFTANGSFAALAENVEYQSSGYARLIRMTDLRQKLETDGIWIDESAYKYLEKSSLVGGELLMASVGSVGLIYLMPEVDYPASLAPNMYLLKTNSSLLSKFLYWSLLSEGGQSQIFQVATTTAQPKLNKDNVRSIVIALPEVQEQTQIARFLDHETARIDALIEEQQRLIELLKEKRQAVISHAVTKGLDPMVPMKDSGVEWLGEVPAHWVVCPLKHFAKVKGRIGFRGYTSDDLVAEEDGALIVGASEMTATGEIELRAPQYICWDKYFESPEIMLEDGDLLVVQRGSTVGKVACFSGYKREATINPSLIVLKELKVDSLFLLRVLQSDYVQSSFSLQRSSTAIPMISQEQVENYKIAMPPFDEQSAIVSRLDNSINKLDLLIGEAQSATNILYERRSTLISAAVTGKIDVRGWQPPASTQAPESAVAEAV